MNQLLNDALPIDAAAMLLGLGRTHLLQAAVAGDLEIGVSLQSLIGWKAKRDAEGKAIGEPSEAPIVEQRQDIGMNVEIGFWTPAERFSHKWPDGTIEEYGKSFKADVQVNGKSRTIYIGITQRASAGLDDRARAIVFYNAPPKQRALVEFSGNGDLTTTTKYASPIKEQGGHTHVRLGQSVPAAYNGMATCIFSEIIVGPYAANSVAVVTDIANRDAMLDIMAKHGIIRGVHRGWL
ncbi:hypothetical protein CCAX7_25880 [Capsulimonas corticalis]|uniref:Uncharacterized protein n=1 Tax=Capsulimonas corticalis TaxID=2219043 RepID=A0A402CVW3_9BACT|nr:hypothetical protein [Capsulimonas corticalis]BDI30537.1 hypothetical protein CCAX7_25880 [Capsulimonas corticalis]